MLCFLQASGGQAPSSGVPVTTVGFGLPSTSVAVAAGAAQAPPVVATKKRAGEMTEADSTGDSAPPATAMQVKKKTKKGHETKLEHN
jgi:hypothetical protein